MTHREYRLKGPYVVLSFLLLLFCVLCGVIVNSVLKSKEQIWPGAVRPKIIILRAVIPWIIAGTQLQTLIYISAGKPAN